MRAPAQTRRLDEVVDVIRGISFPTAAKSHEPFDGSIACLRTANVQREVEWGDLWHVAESYMRRDDQVVRPFDILISNANSLNLVGKVALVKDTPTKATLGTFITLFRTHDGNDPRYVFYQLATPDVQRSIRALASTTTNISNISTSKLCEVQLLLPGIEEQRTTVASIEEQFSRLDAGVASLKRVQANLKRYRASVLKAAIEGRLIPTEAELARQEGRIYETGAQLLERILAERRAKWNGGGQYNEPGAPSASDLGELPEGWAWATVEQLLTDKLVNGVSIKGSDSPPGVRALRLNAMTDRGFDFDQVRYLPIEPSEVQAILVRGGDFFVARGNGSLHLVGRGTLAIEPPDPTIFPDTMIRARLSPHARSWVVCLWASRLMRAQIEKRVKTTAGIYKISQPQIESILLPFPPQAEQDRIVAEVERRLSVAEEIEAAVAANLKRAGRLRQAALASAFR